MIQFITEETYQRLKENSFLSYPDETCGFLFGTLNSQLIDHLKRVSNSVASSQMSSHFMIDPLTVYQIEKEAEEKGDRMIGIYHSHPDSTAVLSEEDKKYMIPGLVYIIVSLTGNNIKKIKGYIKDSPDEEIKELVIRLRGE